MVSARAARRRSSTRSRRRSAPAPSCVTGGGDARPASRATSSRRPSSPAPPPRPTLLSEETFGPVAPIVPVKSLDEAIELANSTRFGLGANIYTRDFKTILRCMREIKAGTVWFNDPLTDNDAGPFGGFKQSGLGRELGREGLEAFQETKHVHIESEIARKEWWYPYSEYTRRGTPRTGPEPSAWGTRPRPLISTRSSPTSPAIPGGSTSRATRAPAADAELIEALGADALQHDLPAGLEGIDLGPEPTPFQQAQQLAAEAWGAERSWFLVNGASGGNHAACLAFAHESGAHARGPPHRGPVVVQRNVHSSTIDGLVLSGLRPVVRRARDRPRARHRPLRHPRGARGGADAEPRMRRRSWSSPRPTSAPSPTSPSLAEVAHARGVPLVVDEAWGAHLYFHDRPPGRRAALRRRPGPLQHPQDRRQPDPVGDPAPRQRRADRPGDRRPLGHPDRVDQPQRPADRLARRRRAAWRPPRAQELLTETLETLARGPRADPRDPRARRPRRAARRRAAASPPGTRCGWRSTFAGPGRPATASPR